MMSCEHGSVINSTPVITLHPPHTMSTSKNETMMKDTATTPTTTSTTIKSTWHHNDPSTWNWWQWYLNFLGAHHHSEGTPVFKSTDPVPYYPVWKQHLWLFPRAIAPLVLHYAVIKKYGSFHPVLAWLGYSMYLGYLGVVFINQMLKFSKVYGFLDADKPRDGVPDLYSGYVVFGLVATVAVRPTFAVFLVYDRYELPSLSLWLPVQGFMYAVVLDFFFYWYHRLMHEVPWLWKYHRLHHVVKHPTAALSPFADEVQEIFDILIIPVMTYMVCRPNFATWWISTVYILYTEAMGHSGLRIYWPTPLTGDVLRLFDAELTLEDHDLHHRKGWKTAVNYGKQTRLWDRVFGTRGTRIECQDDSVDFGLRVDPWL